MITLKGRNNKPTKVFTYDQVSIPSSVSINDTWRERSISDSIVGDWVWNGAIWVSMDTKILGAFIDYPSNFPLFYVNTKYLGAHNNIYVIEGFTNITLLGQASTISKYISTLVYGIDVSLAYTFNPSLTPIGDTIGQSASYRYSSPINTLVSSLSSIVFAMTNVGGLTPSSVEGGIVYRTVRT